MVIMSSNPPPFPLSDTYVPSAWMDTSTGITNDNIGQYAVKFPISQNSPITFKNTLSVAGLITGTTTTQTTNDNSTKLASTSYADNAGSQSASALLGDTNTFTGLNKFTNTNGIVFNKTRTVLDTDGSEFNLNQISGGTAICDNAIRTGGVNIYTKGDGLTANTIKLVAPD